MAAKVTGYSYGSLSIPMGPWVFLESHRRVCGRVRYAVFLWVANNSDGPLIILVLQVLTRRKRTVRGSPSVSIFSRRATQLSASSIFLCPH